MTLETLKGEAKVIGIKQVTKAVSKGRVVYVFMADDADDRVMEPLLRLCEEKEVAVVRASTMQELGKACSIEVGAAAAAVLRQ